MNVPRLRSRLVPVLFLATALFAWGTLSAGAPHQAHQYATGGAGTAANPYVGWEAALAADTEVVFRKGYFESPVTSITVPSGSVLTGMDGAIVQWPANRTSVNPMFIIPAGNSSVVFRGLQFEAGVTVPVTGVTSQGGRAYIEIGTGNSSQVVSRVTVEHCRFGIARYPTSGGAYASDVEVQSGVDDLVIQNNSMNAANVNVILSTGGSTQYTYRRFVFQNNDVAFSQNLFGFAAVVLLGDNTFRDVQAKFEQATIVGNTIRDNNGTFDIGLEGTGLLVANNSVYSDDVDGFGFVGVDGGTIRNVVYSGNSCYGTDPTGDPNKILEPSCFLRLLKVEDATVTGNSFRSVAEVMGIAVVQSQHVVVTGNIVDKAAISMQSSDSAHRCFSIENSSSVAFDSNACVNTGNNAFHILGDGTYGPSEDLSFTNNQLFTTTGSAIARNFFRFVGTESDVTVRENRVWGQNATSFLDTSSATVTNLNRVGNQETIGETGWRIGADQLSDITGTGLAISSGALGIDSTVATLSGTQTLTNKNLTSGNTFPSTMTTDSEWDTAAEINAATTDADFATLAGTETITNKTLTSTTNVFPQTSFITFTTGSAVQTTRWCAPYAPSCDGTDGSKVQVLVPNRFVAKGFHCRAPGGTGSSSKIWTMYVMRNNSGSAITCSISGTSDDQCHDTTHSVTFDALDTIAIQFTATTGGNTPPSALVQCSLGTGP